MLTKIFRNWQGAVTVNGTEYPSGEAIPAELAGNGSLRVILHPTKKAADTEPVGRSEGKAEVTQMSENTQYRIQVRRYMTKPATPDFDFMARWNDNKPMPLRVMIGEKVKETRGMVYMVLHGDILEERTICCMKCGRPITNPVSQYFGLGPECGGHNYVNPFNTDEELKEAVADFRKQLNKMTWEGWIIKSAIESMEEIPAKNC